MTRRRDGRGQASSGGRSRLLMLEVGSAVLISCGHFGDPWTGLSSSKRDPGTLSSFGVKSLFHNHPREDRTC